jgi:hypothetical protein
MFKAELSKQLQVFLPLENKSKEISWFFGFIPPGVASEHCPPQSRMGLYSNIGCSK